MMIKSKMTMDKSTQKDGISNKVKYRSIKFFFEFLNYDFDYERLKLLWFDQAVAKTKTEQKIKCYLDAFKYLLSNTYEGLSESVLRVSYFLLTHQRMNDHKIKTILMEYYNNRTCSAQKNASLIQKIILQEKMKEKTQYAHLLANYILIISSSMPIQIHPLLKKEYRKALKHISVDELLMYSFLLKNEVYVKDMQKQAIKYKKQIETEHIINIINQYQSEIKKHFHITRMYLYGSHTQSFIHESSDVDLMVSFDKPMTLSQKNQIIHACEMFLQSKLDVIIDMTELNQVICQFGIQEVQNAVRII